MSTPHILQDRAVIIVRGDDAESLLQGLITNGPPKDDGQALFSALLTPQGKVLFDFLIVKRPDFFLLDVDAGAASALVKRLTLYRLRAKVEIEIEESSVVGTGDAPDGAIGFAEPRHEKLASRWIGPRALADSLQPDNSELARRIKYGVASCSMDFVSDTVFPMDVNFDLLNGVDYKKGCFVGQEVASRMKRKGQARKRLVIAEFETSPPLPGAEVTAGASTLGHILSGVGNAALAIIRLDRWEAANEALKCDGLDVRLTLPEYLKRN